VSDLKLDYHTLDTLRRDHPAWRLLRADHAPLVISVLYLQPVGDVADLNHA
jgi:hypothetical protein